MFNSYTDVMNKLKLTLQHVLIVMIISSYCVFMILSHVVTLASVYSLHQCKN